MKQKLDPKDLEIIEIQLGRKPRSVIAISARCASGHPAVVQTLPVLDDGTPFPTSFYLCCPNAVAAASTLEAEQVMEELNARLQNDVELAGAYQAAHEDYLTRREATGSDPRIAGISAGGMPSRIKCLHALVGHALAAGPGINPIGDIALQLMSQRGLYQVENCDWNVKTGGENQ